MRIFKPPYLLPLLVALIYFLIVTINIQSTPMIGISDNGDFARTTKSLGIVHINGGDGTGQYLGRLERYYRIKDSSKYTGSFSSGLGVLFLAKLINMAFHPTVFDVKVLGTINTLMFSVGVFLFLFYLRKVNKITYLLSIPFILLVFTDTAYSAYFNSFYEEASGLIFAIVLMAFIFKSIGDKTKKNAKTNFFLVLISSVLLITSKPQYFVLFIPVIVIIPLLFKHKLKKTTLTVAVASICILAVSYYIFGTAEVVKKWNVYNTVFAQVLGSSGNRSHAIDMLGIDSRYLKYAGIPAYSELGGVNDINIKKYLSVTMFVRVLTYYITTPAEVLNLSQKLSKISFSPTIPFLRYYEDAIGEHNGFNFWSDFRLNWLSKFYKWQPALLIISLLLSVLLYKNMRRNIFVVGIFISLSAVSQFCVVLVSEGVFGVPEKHLLLFNAFRDTLLIYWMLVFVFWLRLLLSKKPHILSY